MPASSQPRSGGNRTPAPTTAKSRPPRPVKGTRPQNGQPRKAGKTEHNERRPEHRERRPERNERRFKHSERRPAAEPREFPLPVVPASDWSPDFYQVPEKEGLKRFQDFALPAPILHGIADLGFQYCTPIQAASLTQTMAGENVAGRAQTGTGKTAAFLIATLKRMLEQPEKRPTRTGRPAALVLAPTRELVIQIISDAEALGKHCGLRCLAVFGGCDHEKQQHAIEEQPLDLIAATPGRLLDFKNSRVLDLRGIHTLVIDEADRMLDMGFIPDVRRIVRALPEERQTLLFSATLGQDVMNLASQWMPNPVEISVDPEFCPAETIRQIVYPIASSEKFAVLYNVLKQHEGERVLIFRNRKHECEDLLRELLSRGIEAAVLSGDVDQRKRIRILEDFRAGKVKVVIATDVAARGLQIDEITLVVNYDFPYEADDYIHRIGRTGRAGEKGTAVSFACEDESFIIPDIEKLIERALPCEMPEEALFAEPPAPSVELPPRERPPRGSFSGNRRPPARRNNFHRPHPRGH